MVAIKNTLLLAALASIPSALGYQRYEKCNQPGLFALTFDDGPNVTTPKLLDLLKKEGIKATFFVNGDNYMGEVMKNPEAQGYIKREFEEGHIVASHTFTHPNDGITVLSDKALTKELKDLNDMLQELIGVQPAFFRPPLGEYNAKNEKVLEAQGFTANINWSIDPLDWDDNGKKPLDYYLKPYRDILSKADPTKDSFIALNHDVYENTVSNIIPEVIKLVRQYGFKFVTMDECLGLKAYQNSDVRGGVSDNTLAGNTNVGNTNVGNTSVGYNPVGNNTNAANNGVVSSVVRGNDTMVRGDNTQNLQKSGSIATKSISALSAIALVSLTLLNFF
jgi:peptidoglycan/xylan/chitin deacetylase (PgdA/CDA1 family)